LLVDFEKVRFAVEQVRLAEVEDAGQGQREADGDDEERPSISTNIIYHSKKLAHFVSENSLHFSCKTF